MKCDDVQQLLIDGSQEHADPAARQAAMEHLGRCRSCRDAEYAAGVLRLERSRPVPGPTPGAMQRAIAAATRAHAEGREARNLGVAAAVKRRPAGFWAGMSIGAALAASFAVAWVAVFSPRLDAPATAAATPQVTLAVNETRDVNIAVDTPAALEDAEIHVVLTGSIGLAGFADQRELRWRTNLEAGSNRLTLPIIATGASGQLFVEVHHQQKRRTFIVDVRGVEA